jgi:hypothetical protein
VELLRLLLMSGSKSIMIANYTTTVSADRSVMEIERMLVVAGAEAIQKRYDAGGLLDGLDFRIVVKDAPMHFRLPARTQAVEEVLGQQVRRPRKGTHEKIRQQAARVAWRIIRDWVRAQLAIVKLQQAELSEVFLAYMLVDAEDTVYSRLKCGGV